MSLQIKLFGKRQNNKKQKFREDYHLFKGMTAAVGDDRFELNEKDFFPCLNDATGSTGFDAHYVYHTAWAMRRIIARAPERHVDVSSYLYFSSLLSAVIPVDFYDYRPANLRLSGLRAGRADLNALPFADNSITSLSCMHTVEHVGLGRYGDELAPQGDLKAIGELSRVLAPKGYLYFVVPIGRPRLCFNAHRIYGYRQIVESFPTLKLVEFSLIPDDALQKGMLEHADPSLADTQDYACGCFIFTKSGGTDADC